MANMFLPNRTPPDGDDPINHWKRQIGFSEEPVQDSQGYWTIGYGQRINDTPGGPKPYATVSEPIAHDELPGKAHPEPWPGDHPRPDLGAEGSQHGDPQARAQLQGAADQQWLDEGPRQHPQEPAVPCLP